MNKVIIKVEGKVQGVGLGAAIKSIADDLGIRGTVENKDDGSVQIVCEAERSAIDEMLRRIQSDTTPVIVKKITQSEPSVATGMNAFEILMDDVGKEIFATLHVGIYELRNVNKTLNRIDTRQGEMNKTLNRIDTRQGEMNKTLNRMDNTQNEMNKTLNRMDNTQNEMKDTMHEMNQKQDSLLYLQEGANATLKSIDHKMDASLSNDEKILSGMQNGGTLHVPKQ